MSVRSGDRTQGKLQVLDLATKLCTYTMKMCKNEKHFPKSQRWLLTSRITGEALDAMTCIRRANATLVDGPDMEIRHDFRSAQQTEAHGHLCALYSLIDVAYNLHEGLGEDSVRYWTEMIRDTDEKLKAWIRSDQKSYTDKQNA